MLVRTRRAWCLAVLVLCAVSALSEEPRCRDQVTAKTHCKCLDWTGRVSCMPLTLPMSDEECRAVGGVWGKDVRRAMDGRDPDDETCVGDWDAKPTAEEAEEVFDILTTMREGASPSGPSEALLPQAPSLAPSLGATTASSALAMPVGSLSPVNSPAFPPVGGGFGGGGGVGGGVPVVPGGFRAPWAFNASDAPREDGKARDFVVSPSYGPSSGGIWVQLMGVGAHHTPNSVQCKLDLVEQFCYSNHHYYTWCYMSPKCAGVYDFTCANGPLRYASKFAVVAKTPWVTSVYPYSGDVHGGTEVTVRGWNFEPHCPSQLLCRFGNQVVHAKYYTSSSVMCVAPCNAKGFVSVEVSNDGGAHWSMSGVQFGFVGDDFDPSSSEECAHYLAK